MAIMIPQECDLSRRPMSEQIVFKYIKEYLSDRWKVFHSFDYLSRDLNYKLWDGEIDFLLFHPEHGILVIEVKGGAISYRDGQWYQENKLISPVEQARKNKYAVRKLLQDRLLKPIPLKFAHAVCFPSCGNQQIWPIEAQDIVLTKDSLPHIETFAKQLESKGWKFESKTPLRINREYGLIKEETWYFEGGKFWEFSKCHLEVKVLVNSRLIYSVEVSERYYYYSSTQELLEALSKIYGKFSKNHKHHLNYWDRQIGRNRIRVLEGTYYRDNSESPALYITYANHLEKENERIKKEFSDEVDRRRKAEQEAKRRRANQDL